MLHNKSIRYPKHRILLLDELANFVAAIHTPVPCITPVCATLVAEPPHM